MTEEKFDEVFWSYNCPLQMWKGSDDGTWSVINYMPRKMRIADLSERVTKEELPSFCENTARILRNLAELFDALGEGKIDQMKMCKMLLRMQPKIEKKTKRPKRRLG